MHTAHGPAAARHSGPRRPLGRLTPPGGYGHALGAARVKPPGGPCGAEVGQAQPGHLVKGSAASGALRALDKPTGPRLPEFFAGMCSARVGPNMMVGPTRASARRFAAASNQISGSRVRPPRAGSPRPSMGAPPILRAKYCDRRRPAALSSVARSLMPAGNAAPRSNTKIQSQALDVPQKSMV